jgi:hypothetical protein
LTRLSGLGATASASGITYTFYPVAGNPSLIRQVKSAVGSAGLEVLDVLSFYLQSDMDLDSMLPALAFGAELGATYALVIGDDPDWVRMYDDFGHFCSAVAQMGLSAALEAPVNARGADSAPGATAYC